MVEDLLLGSASPRRAQLLAQLGLRFQQRAAAIDETPRDGEPPRTYVRRMAEEKAAALASALGGEDGSGTLLTADTTVILDGRSLGKPVGAEDARTMLRDLSGREHEVCTAVCVMRDQIQRHCLVSTQVEFAELSEELIDCYLATDEPWDKAGAYAIQGSGGAFVRRVSGSVSNVIGLPLVETRELLQAMGIPCPLAAAAP